MHQLVQVPDGVDAWANCLAASVARQQRTADLGFYF